MQFVAARSRRIIQLIILLLVLTLFTGVMASNASDAVPALSVPQVEGQPGATVQVPVNLNSGGQVVGLQFDLNFDEQVLQYQSGAKGTLTADYSLALHQLSSDKVRVIITHPVNTAIAAGTGSVAVLSFKVADSAQPGQSSPLDLTGVVLSDSAARSIQPFEQANGTFKVLGTLTLNIPPVGPLTVGQTFQLVPTTVPGGATYTYRSDNPSAATVSDTGLITAVCGGSANITVTASMGCYNEISQTIPVTVDIGTMTINVSQPGTIKVGQTFLLQPVTVPGGAAFSYQSNNGAVATVSPGGLITAVSPGSASITITATKDCYSGATLDVPVTVESADLALTVEPVAAIKVGETTQINAATVPGGATISYATLNPAIATVSDAGLITGICIGTASFTVSASMPGYNPASTTVSVTVNKGVMTLGVTPPDTALTLGETFQLAPSTVPGGAAFSYSSDNTAVATVSDTGRISAVCPGRASITVRASKDCYEDATRTFTVDVLTGTIDLSVSPESVSLAVYGSQKQLAVTTTPSDAAVQYSSSDESVVKVDATGKLTAVGLGSATVTVTASRRPCYDDQAKIVTVTVTCVKADVNRDGIINVLDAVRAIDITLERLPAPSPWESCAADMNEDGGITVEDVLAIINRALL